MTDYDYNEELEHVRKTLQPVIASLYFDVNDPMTIIEVLTDQADYIEAMTVAQNWTGGFEVGTYEVTKAVREVGKTTIKKVED
jgi:hypothetical protein